MLHRTILRALILLFVTLNLDQVHGQYTPDWPSLDTRPLPTWYDEAKFGIFMHWGVYSVPSFGSEWFWWSWQGDKSPSYVSFMEKNFKPGFSYADFGPLFTTEFFDATRFANIIKSSGAKYLVLTSKHHEGYTMWPSNYSWNWNAMDVGPHRDLVGELSVAIRKAGIHFGLYFSQFAWFNPLYVADKKLAFATQEYVKSVTMPQLSEIVNNYKPDVIWSDGDWEAPYQYWNTTQFLAWLYNDSPVKDTVVTNDRWGIGTTCKHGDFFTCSDKFNPGVLLPHKWENCMTVDQYSWGFRRTARYEDFMTIQGLISTLASTISCGGNLLMNVGPTHDGLITPMFEERLVQMGQFVQVNKEAIFSTKPWIHQNDTLTPNIWYVSRLTDNTGHNARRLYNHQISDNTVVYAYVLNWPKNDVLTLGAPQATAQTKVSMLGYPGNLKIKGKAGSGIVVDFSKIAWKQLPNTWSWVLKLENLADDNRIPNLYEAAQFVKKTTYIDQLEFPL